MAVQPGLCRTGSETPQTGFLTTRLKCSTGAVEDEQHFKLNAQSLLNTEIVVFKLLTAPKLHVDNFQKFFLAVNDEMSDILHKIGQYLHEHLN